MSGGAWVGVECKVCGEVVKARSERSDEDPLARIATAFSMHMVVRHPSCATELERSFTGACEAVQ